MPSKALSKNMSNIDFKARVGAPAALGSIAAASIDFSSWELVSWFPLISLLEEDVEGVEDGVAEGLEGTTKLFVRAAIL